MKTKKTCSIFVLLLVFLCGVFCFHPTPVFATQSSVASVNTLLQKYFLDNFEDVKNRVAGSAGERAMAENLQNFCTENAYNFFGQNMSYEQKFDLPSGQTSQNILAQIGATQEYFVVLGAHYDAVYVPEKSYGFHDNISGVVAVMEAAKILETIPNVTVVLAFWGAEEIGCLGSGHFVQNLSEEQKRKILLYINFDSVGAGDFEYYYTNDFGSTYGHVVDDVMSGLKIKKYQNELFSPRAFHGVNYTNLGFETDNISFLKAGINSLNFFSGNLNTNNGLGYFETKGQPKIMHNLDTKETVENFFGETHFAEHIVSFAEATAVLLTDQTFAPENYFFGQIQTWLFNVATLKFFGAGLVVLGFGAYLAVYYFKYKKNKK